MLFRSIQNNLLERHIEFLQNNDWSLKPDKNWLVRIRYDKFWQEAKGREDFKEQEINICRDKDRNYFPDNINIQLLDRPGYEELKTQLKSLLDNVQGIAGDAFLPSPFKYYHVTVFPSQGRLSPAERKKVHQAIAQTKPFRIIFKGVILTRDSLMLKGYPDNNEIFDLRERLEAKIGERRHHVYPVVHLTLGRFTKLVGKDKYDALKKLAEANIDREFDSVEIDSVNVVDWSNAYELAVSKKETIALGRDCLCPNCIGQAIAEGKADFDEELMRLWNDRIQQGDVFKYRLSAEDLPRKKVGRLLALYNPGRAEFDQDKHLSGRDNNLVYEPFGNTNDYNKISQRFPQQRLIDLMIDSEHLAINVNYSSLWPNQFLLIPATEACHPQYLTEQALRAAFKIFRLSKTENLCFGFNSRGAWASVNHLHLQGFYYTPVEGSADLPIMLASRKEVCVLGQTDRKSTRLNSSHTDISRMPSSA